MHAPVDTAERAALATLSAIQTYVMTRFFMPAGLARGLGRKVDKIAADVQWLKDHGYVAEAPGTKYLYVTPRGWQKA